jgi:hypothetical protein
MTSKSDTSSSRRRGPSATTFAALLSGAHDGSISSARYQHATADGRPATPGHEAEPDGEGDRQQPQPRAARLLTELLARATVQALPAVEWTVGATGEIGARCLGPTNADRRGEFEAWANALGATAGPAVKVEDAVRLRAVVHGSDVLTDISVIADIADEHRGAVAGTTADRCAAAHVADPRACEGRPDAVRIADVGGASVDACVLHGAVLLASVEGSRVALLHGEPGAATQAHRRARSLPPFDFLRGPGVKRVASVEDAAVFPNAPTGAEPGHVGNAAQSAWDSSSARKPRGDVR